MSKSEVSRLCTEIDERVGAFLERPIEGEWPYLWLDATYVKAIAQRSVPEGAKRRRAFRGRDHRIVSVAVSIHPAKAAAV